jgi:surface antigen
MRRVLAIASLLALAACAAPRAPAPPGALEGEARWTCVTYARERSGLALRGDAWTWWDAATGRYERGRAPRPGSVLVINRTSRMRDGHLAVVTRVINAREIRVDHANWASGSARGREARDQPVRDVSPDNDWSLVRVWYPRINDFGGTAVPVRGFVHASRSLAAR